MTYYSESGGRSPEREKKKLPSFSEAAIDLLKLNPREYLITLAVLCEDLAQREAIPAQDIPALIEAFTEAKSRVAWIVEEAIMALREQAEKAKKKEKEKKGG